MRYDTKFCHTKNINITAVVMNEDIPATTETDPLSGPPILPELLFILLLLLFELLVLFLNWRWYSDSEHVFAESSRMAALFLHLAGNRLHWYSRFRPTATG